MVNISTALPLAEKMNSNWKYSCICLFKNTRNDDTYLNSAKEFIHTTSPWFLHDLWVLFQQKVFKITIICETNQTNPTKE